MLVCLIGSKKKKESFAFEKWKGSIWKRRLSIQFHALRSGIFLKTVDALNIRAFVWTLALKVATLQSKNTLIRNKSITLNHVKSVFLFMTISFWHSFVTSFKDKIILYLVSFLAVSFLFLCAAKVGHSVQFSCVMTFQMNILNLRIILLKPVIKYFQMVIIESCGRNWHVNLETEQTLKYVMKK